MTSELIVLDVDDTLYLERDYVKSGFRAVGEFVQQQYGVSDFSPRAWALFEIGAKGNVFNLVSDQIDLQLESSQIDELVGIYRTHRPQIQLLADARDFIDRVRCNARIAVVTDGPAASQNAKVDALGLRDIADEIVVTSERGSEWHKPSQTAFRFLQECFDVESSNCVYYGDNPTKDFIGPRALGWNTVRVRRLGGLHCKVPDFGEATRLIQDFEGEGFGNVGIESFSGIK